MPGDYVSFDQGLYVRMTLFLEDSSEFKNQSELVNRCVAEGLIKRGVELPTEVKVKLGIEE